MEETLSIIKYKPIEGYVDQFEAELQKLYQINKASGFADKATVRFTKLDDGSFIQIMICPTMDVLIEEQDEGLAWLDSVDHLLQKDEHGSRTEAVTGFTFNWS
jgi:hypothetical protein|tara:strand:+ start:520 stop:828 length:309 start_codon:yes stop_codon:yes gene_type:complete